MNPATYYDDDPNELLALMRRVLVDHPSTVCERCRRDLLGPGSLAMSAGDWDAAYALATVETSPENIRLLSPEEAVDVWGGTLDDHRGECREFSYCHGLRCPECESDLVGPLALYGPRCEWPDGPREAAVHHPTALVDLTLWAD